MKTDISRLIHLENLYVYSIDLVEHLEHVWLDKNFPDRPPRNRIDLHSDGTCVMECERLAQPIKMGNYDKYTIKLTDQQTKEYKTLRHMHDMFYVR